MALYLIIALCSKCAFSVPQVSPVAQTSGAAPSDISIEYVSIQEGQVLAGPGFIYPGSSTTTSGFAWIPFPAVIGTVPTIYSPVVASSSGSLNTPNSLPTTSSPSPSLPFLFPSMSNQISAGFTWSHASGSVGSHLAQSIATFYATSGGYTWTASDSGNSGPSPSALAPHSFAPSVAASSTPTSGPVLDTVTQVDGVIAEGPATIQTEVSTATPAIITTVVYTDSPVIVTTVTTSLLCTCDQADEQSVDSNQGSFSRRDLASKSATTTVLVHSVLLDTSPETNFTASIGETIRTDLATALVNSPDTTLSVENASATSTL